MWHFLRRKLAVFCLKSGYPGRQLVLGCFCERNSSLTFLPFQVLLAAAAELPSSYQCNLRYNDDLLVLVQEQHGGQLDDALGERRGRHRQQPG